ncbi:MAG: prolyl oligopeptidase family serine peptidase [Planctomycetes bacterium]|nr:prolyl oligopeptidase family serine peptidase [Planctomycetota bacterium]
MRTTFLAALILTCALAPLADADPTTHTAHSPKLPILPDIGPKEALKVYRSPAETFQVHLSTPKVTRTYIQYEVSFPSIRQNRWKTVTGLYFEPVGLKPGAKVPGAVVVHHLGGRFDAEVILAQHLASNGVAAFFLELPNYGKRRIKGTKQGFVRLGADVASEAFQQAALDVIRSADFLRSRPEVANDQVGAVGISLGAFVTAVARGVDPRLRRTVLLLGGGGLDTMIHSFKESKALLDHLGVKPEELGAIFKNVDPITFASRVHPSDVLMVNGLKDKIVPPQATKNLWNALGRPQIKWYDADHFGLLNHLPEVLDMTLKHLAGRSTF